MMMKKIQMALLALALGSNALWAEEAAEESQGLRFEFWLGATSFAGLQDLQPAEPGRFERTGLALGGAVHGRARQFAHSDLLAGMDIWVSANDSHVTGPIDTLVARQFYVGGSLKWMLGPRRNFSLDVGTGLHMIDIAELNLDYFFGLEHRSWEATRLGAFAGATWDIGGGRPGKSGAFTVGVKVHTVDFGNVHDEDVLFGPILGPNAGLLKGPVYLMQVGYAIR